MEKTILHIDMNNFFASVECIDKPELGSVPLAVCGDEKQRHGIVLAKNELAKKYGIKTGMVLWEARQKCPELVCVGAHMDNYIKYSKLARQLYYNYTDQIEPFGIDECWLDVTGSAGLFGSGEDIAERIRNEVKDMGLTVSIGVSFNKIFAKLGSDYKKPDAVTVFSKSNYRDMIWPLDVGDMMFVGRATGKKLRMLGINTIGDLALTPAGVLESKLGKMGKVLWSYANGYDDSPVLNTEDSVPIKSIGNSTTTPRDLETDYDVKTVLYSLSDTVATRMRDQGFRCGAVEIWIRRSDMESFVRQHKLEYPTCLTNTVAREAFSLFLQNYDWNLPIRGVGVRVSGLTPLSSNYQLDMFADETKNAGKENLAFSIDTLRKKYGYSAVLAGIAISDNSLKALSPEDCRRNGAGMYELTPQLGR